ncbi:hypothetical protein Trydic_g3963 [Trypoxylus dichotomus]
MGGTDRLKTEDRRTEKEQDHPIKPHTWVAPIINEALGHFGAPLSSVDASCSDDSPQKPSTNRSNDLRTLIQFNTDEFADNLLPLYGEWLRRY